jgi:hypothetical protein
MRPYHHAVRKGGKGGGGEGRGEGKREGGRERARLSLRACACMSMCLGVLQQLSFRIYMCHVMYASLPPSLPSSISEGTRTGKMQRLGSASESLAQI